MQQVYEVFQELDEGTVEIIIQEPGMNEEKERHFWLNFRQRGKNTDRILCDGWNFGEGIDLKRNS